MIIYMTLNKKELNRLSPAERIKRLKLMEESKKKEVDEIEKLIKESMHELNIGKIADDIAPEQKPVDISKLFEADDAGLERTARKESNRGLNAAPGYQAIAQTYEAYSQLQKLDKSLSLYGNLSDDQLAQVGAIGEKLNRVEKYMTESEKAASKLDAGKAVLYKLKKETGLE